MSLSAPTRFTLSLVAVTGIAAALRLYGVAVQPLLGDEQLAAASATHFVESGQFGPTMWFHPNLRNLVLWCVGEAAGHGPLALRSTSLTLGILTIPLVAALLHLLTRDSRAALLASALLAVEQVHITFSRQAIQETWTTFLFLLGATFAVLAWRRRAQGWLLAAGVAFGLGVASKFHALFPLAACLAAGLLLSRRERSPALAAWVVACLVLLPATIYLATYTPWFARGYDLAEWFGMQRVVLASMATHAGNPMDQVFDTAAWQWFLRPMGYANFVFAEGRPFVTISHSNPFVWLGVLPSAAVVAHAARSGSHAATGQRFALTLFTVAYLPLALSPRPIWLLSSLAVLPFALMLVALAVSHLLATTPERRWLALAWGAIVLASSLAIYPMAIGRADPEGPLGAIVERFRPAQERGALTR